MRVPMMQIGGNRKEPSLANKPHALRLPADRLNDALAIGIKGFVGFEKLIIDWSFLSSENTQHRLAGEVIRRCSRFGRLSGVNI
ncbi:hypothetical protein TNCV_3266001 [Trichonephila clavipes]|nr:hypothetical protein TNCV_3266001 [Trichonephila clavipes]